LLPLPLNPAGNVGLLITHRGPFQFPEQQN
jgi:hypothetical protein